MTTNISDRIGHKLGIPDIVALLAEGLSGSEFNSLLLDVYNQRLTSLSPAQLLQQYQANRFVHPAPTDMIGLLRLELTVLELLKGHAFQPIELSPAAQLGTCAVVGPVDQKKIISATRNTEITADATNSLALHIADLKKSGKPAAVSPPSSEAPPAAASAQTDHSPPAADWLRFCTVHRHIRTQELKGKGFTPHFKIGCMVTSGRDIGSCQFECQSLQEQLSTLDHLFREVFGVKEIRFRLLSREGYESRDHLLERVGDHLKKYVPALNISYDESPPPNNYYKGIQFKMDIELSQGQFEIADGGFVDWTQQLLDNRKERFLIAGFGLGLMYQLQNGAL